ncbi:hypothetical protein B0J12DRAFT_704160 [Macrophomina phaseolina]|uniref:F-box domain-containing protein n=1 Tax=Macrophomina phaseolina TaxID=35725 RepID=A0ABQ8FW59_9PEZI|nr:hypothetical protein B0J12DRAFT_704160 [Macrophomina phaseolina]
MDSELRPRLEYANVEPFPTAYLQRELPLTLLTWCFNCLNGSCSRHQPHIAEPADTDARDQSTLHAIEIMGRLPAELKLEVIDNLDVRTLLSLRRAEIPSELGMIWGYPYGTEQGMIAKLFRRFTDELTVFPAVARPGSTTVPNGNLCGDGRISEPQHLLFLEVVQNATTALISFLSSSLNLDHARLSSQRGTILHLWRLFLVPVTTAEDASRQEIFTYFNSLPRATCNDILHFISSIGRAYTRVHRLRRHPTWRTLGRSLAVKIRAQCCSYFAMEYLRVGMTNLWTLARAGTTVSPADVCAAFTRDPRCFPGPGFLASGWLELLGANPAVDIEIDAWTYRVRVDAALGVVELRVPWEHSVDMWKALCRAWALPEDGPPLQIAAWEAAHARRPSWVWDLPEGYPLAGDE